MCLNKQNLKVRLDLVETINFEYKLYVDVCYMNGLRTKNYLSILEQMFTFLVSVGTYVKRIC